MEAARTRLENDIPLNPHDRNRNRGNVIEAVRDEITRAGRRRALLVVCAAVMAVWTPAPARAATPLGLTSCGPAHGVYQCSGLVPTWDGVPLDTTVTLPSAGAHNLPLVVEIHGFGNSKYEYLDPGSQAYTDNAFGWARRGYAVLTATARGFWGSCGTPESRLASPVACAGGYLHLADDRYEARDSQYLAGLLVDQGLANRWHIGVTGDSYGGGQSFILAALRDRTMLPDGHLVPWRSLAGTQLSIAAAAPVIPWTDVIYSLFPNGRTLTYTVTPGGVDSSPPGVEKASFVNGIYAAGQAATGPGQPTGEPFVMGRPMGYFAPLGLDPEADVSGWVARGAAGEPYTDAAATAIIERLTRYHSAYYVKADRAPPPLFVANGFTDDLFPADEALRYVNRVRRDFPHIPMAVWLFDFGHMRGTNKPPDRARFLAALHAWFDRYLRGHGSVHTGVTAMTQTCPHSARSEGPFAASSFAGLAHGEVRYSTTGAQAVLSSGGNPAIAQKIDPVTAGDACAATDAAAEPGTASYLLPAAPRRGYTLLGAPTVIARLAVSGAPGVAQLAGRLWDVAPNGSSQTLVARGLYRPSGSGTEVWQLHANGWRFAQGHRPKLELL
ncbi:MAG: type transport system ATP-binding protein, partial [Solirubrobacteraceae bacterium]|nr:type transport system ATP-binding protein [Solirubrobacteraceae bacterium]